VSLLKSRDKADVAQLVEQSIRNRQVIGSSPIVGSILSSRGSNHQGLVVLHAHSEGKVMRCASWFADHGDDAALTTIPAIVS
jgi:hypothetical protein